MAIVPLAISCSVGGGGGSRESSEGATDPSCALDGDLVIGTASPPRTPWVDGDPADGSGFEAALIKELVRRLEVDADRVRMVSVPDGEVVNAAERFDIGVGQYRESSAAGVAYSRGYYRVPQAVVTTRKEVRPTSRAELRATEVAVVAGSAGALLATRGSPRAKVTSYGDLGSVSDALRDRREATAIVDLPDADELMARVPAARLVGLARSPGKGAPQLRIALPAGSGLVGCVDRVLDDLEAEGVLRALDERWLRDAWKATTLR
ncbi:substrate-binding periplasmic protein [Nocardioides nitrophenolicus]|uniref:substrate-binding periplasmic protein n=1 Tax=Nocardioides nitrophenolicus TaxID=60489 RepID=UPI001959D448|nr:transporter substrate-binding domain-containing protein [Nocardioides nitrophenolicus]MBM7517304.1 polar amino acid transport system substrate-binding protein [Nocardioides nitrophenolicus]